MRYCLVLLVCVAMGAIYAAEPMERPVDTESVWDSQADGVVPAIGAHPEFTGMMVWSGRADRNYKPFFQWEFRVQAGVETLRGLRVRIQPLAPDLTPLQKGRTGAWEAMGNLAAGAEADVSYKFNTPIFSAYRIEMTWRGGQASYLATDRQMLPLKEGAADAVSQLVALEPIWDRSRKGKTKLSFWLRNTGGAPAKQVSLTIRLRDGTGKVVYEHPYTPENGTIPAGYAQEHSLVIAKTPSFSTIQIAISKSEESAFALEDVDFSGGDVVEIGRVQREDGQMTGGLRNGTSDLINNVQVTFYFTDATGETVAERVVDIAAVAPNETIDWTLSVQDVPAWVGYETDLAYGIQDGSTSAEDASEPIRPQVVVEGLALTVLEHAGASGVLKMKSELHNQSEADMPGLKIVVAVTGADGPIEMEVGDLAQGERMTLTLLAQGVEQLRGLSMSWQSKGP